MGMKWNAIWSVKVWYVKVKSKKLKVKGKTWADQETFRFFLGKWGRVCFFKVCPLLITTPCTRCMFLKVKALVLCTKVMALAIGLLGLAKPSKEGMLNPL